MPNTLVIGCTKGFELAELDSVYTQDLLDPSDNNLAFTAKRDSINALDIFKIDDDSFFLCYSGFEYS